MVELNNTVSESDPRVFFASERTLLAWFRTGIAIIALGFVVSRFGLFVQLLTSQLQEHAAVVRSSLPSALGVAFVIVGTLTIFLAAVQHRRFIATLPQADLPQSYSPAFAILLSLLVGTLGIFLAGYLITQP